MAVAAVDGSTAGEEAEAAGTIMAEVVAAGLTAGITAAAAHGSIGGE
jgi:hypothetical protein